VPYRIEPRPNDGVIAVIAAGEVSVDDIRRSLMDAFAASQATGMPNLIVDMREIAGLPPTSELYDVHMEMFRVHAEIEPRSACALLVRADQRPEMRFYEDLAENRGILYKLFADYDEALTWVGSDFD
jgi:hypothetical protein